jgi:hypothetical protein
VKAIKTRARSFRQELDFLRALLRREAEHRSAGHHRTRPLYQLDPATGR